MLTLERLLLGFPVDGACAGILVTAREQPIESFLPAGFAIAQPLVDGLADDGGDALLLLRSLGLQGGVLRRVEEHLYAPLKSSHAHTVACTCFPNQLF